MRWIVQHEQLVSVMTDEDLAKAAPLFEQALRLWQRYGVEGGSCVLGAGIAVLYLPPRCRKPVERVVIPSPWQVDVSRTVSMVLKYLALHGIPAFHEPGRVG